MSISDHADYSGLESRLKNLLSAAKPLKRNVFRMVNPKYCKDADLIGGEGGRRSSGRWNLRGKFRCTYASYTAKTALEEIMAATRRKALPDQRALPRTLVCLRVEVKKALDLTDGRIRQRCRISDRRMVDERWWSENNRNREALTQAIGRAAFEAGFEAITVPSAADRPHGVNVVILTDRLLASSRITVETPVKA